MQVLTSSLDDVRLQNQRQQYVLINVVLKRAQYAINTGVEMNVSVQVDTLKHWSSPRNEVTIRDTYFQAENFH